ncbi:hypothetical protein PoB_003692800 [Plakobranchus ocellatus]|uniref:Uncharacterized protein n=1 Tax=Plakobranchus ocellatus TaxID=259542 RepID=A0AAV4AV31_9GAST|nr:hypothetical protein PoB_003692800 [Plakobranchus ocellatus]
MNKLDAVHRKQLRKVLNMQYATTISNQFPTISKICKERPLSSHIIEYVGAFLDTYLDGIEIPANKAMQAYFNHLPHRIRGRSLVTLPITTRKDLT